ncbi:hypothetical protein NLG97_g2460 [Lecanicillium saksenae]|uniref:Uncharacterized protein n=1 Tax=Lecanicillium saksenae TaxID=468837 RepID=A0ACC1R495_9HYPO|nr:hypothetical protein NLG97_g2460 [Lecanicillium saksenae]
MNNSCRFPHNSDLYGIGIRIGLYCQWVTSLIAQAYVPTEVPAVQTATQSFQTAILISLVILTSKDLIHEPEVLIVLPLCFGGFLTSHHVPSPTNDPGSRSRRLISGFNFGALVSYSAWFWSHGVVELHGKCQDCVYVTLLFGRWDIMALRTFGIIMSSAGCLVFLILAALCVWRISAIVNVEGARASLMYLISASTSSPTGPPTLRPRWQTWFQVVVALIGQSHIVAMVELTLIWNPQQDPSGVIAAGQMIPLVVGAWGLVRVVYLFLISHLRQGQTAHREPVPIIGFPL